METFDKDRYAETAFKRLYWQGYQGRFGVFRWPTRCEFYEFKEKWYGLNPATNPTHYDTSEQIAWNSATALHGLLAKLNAKYPGRVYLLGHSMGNIVAGEALRLAAQSGQPVVNTYVASQAALTAHLYDLTIADPNAMLQWHHDHPEIDNLIEGFNCCYGPETPNIYGNWLAGNSGGAARRINFYNPNDYAQSRWEYDQIAKPQKINEAILTDNPLYWFAGVPYSPADFNALPPYGMPHYAPGSIDDYAPWNHFYVGRLAGTTPAIYWVGTPLDIMNNLQHRYQVMAHASEARVKALGALSVDTLTQNVNLARQGNSPIWPADTQNPERPYSRHKWHSAQFRMNNTTQKDYWKTLLGPDAFNLPNF